MRRSFRTIPAAATAALLAATSLAAAEPAAAQVEAPATYVHAPVTLWLAPHVGTGGLTSARLRTNLALSLGASGYARLDGLDLGVGASWVEDSVTGAQITAGLNRAGTDARGLQLSAGANLAGRDVTGAQVAAGFNHAGGDVRGAQIALVNIGGEIRGAQVGLVNVARGVKGAQIGLINVAGESSAPIGLLNFIRDGQHHLELWGSDSAPLNLSLKLGGRHVYSILSAGLASSGGTDRWMAGLGLGGHVPLGRRLYLEPELMSWHVNEGWTVTRELSSLSSLRLLVGYRVHRRLAIFGGPTLNLLATRVGDGGGFGLIRGTRLSDEGSETTVRAWPGLVAGVQL